MIFAAYSFSLLLLVDVDNNNNHDDKNVVSELLKMCGSNLGI